ncbi:ABC transporter ATP-binding protein [Reyranella sp. CPCC 100927]|uniref:ABC transporter ATP-binding protein n=1 Tax=Reyranella sp. CPCC 100927 TaxID=2599616 RepID=UPI001C49866B|nr:ABC transporter ATP-binding protein [Reyranella sp. CPCC 100927]
MLTIEKFSASYGPVHALHGIDLRVEAGEAVCLLGSNGAGKSTLIRSLMGLGPLVSGAAHFEGRDLSVHAVEDRVRLGLAVVFEGRGILPAMSVHENLLMGGYCRSRADIAQTLEQVVALFPLLASRRNQPAGTLSGGEQQMLAIARALMSRPKMIMLDEPSMGLAPIVVEQVFEAIAEVNRRGVAILLVEQNMHMALAVAQRFYVLDRGAVVLAGTVSDGVLTSNTGQVLHEDEIESAYMGEKT